MDVIPAGITTECTEDLGGHQARANDQRKCRKQLASCAVGASWLADTRNLADKLADTHNLFWL